ncbi:aminotransferase class I/II-fold pyridoxal phosphate-dependent enzyme [Nocardia sp. NPDC051030]|uniref:pyridoxal phosphate-dependent aminotransferase n=1 Tax=Nocardia sp. NPDC051030 TaxID=3155162 RepID=UPI003412A351
MPTRSISPNLALDELVARRKAEGATILHMGFGESRLPVFAPLVTALTAGADRNAYGPVAGGFAVRDAVAGYFTRRRLPTEAAHTVLAPGSKPLLMALQHVLPGDVLLPAPSWVTYAPQAKLVGKQVFGVPIPVECGGVPDPAALRETIAKARAGGRDPRILILNLPDNPTGTFATAGLIGELCEIAAAEDLIVLSDEIYRDILHVPGADLVSPAELIPDRTIVLTGLSKSLALGGWRIGAARFPNTEWGERVRDDVLAVASEIWSTLAGPMQAVAEYVYAEPPEVVARRNADTRLHAAVAKAVYEVMVEAGADCRPPTGGFYVYPDFEPVRAELAGRGITDSESLQRLLLERHDIAVLGAGHFGDDPRALRFRAATSMLYGDTEEQRATALYADDPLALPHIREQLLFLADGLAKFVGGSGGR